ncbi:hypothetical protein K439DRAFT_1624190 [Ramaria rubella]|nr:hypothetical protein K439DRAFT_1624190 [Ramaria rubella]
MPPRKVCVRRKYRQVYDANKGEKTVHSNIAFNAQETKGFNDESDDEDEEPDIFGNEDINERNYNSQTKNTKKRKGKQGRKGNKKRKEDDNESVNMDYESDVDMDAIVYVTSKKNQT